MTQVGSTDTSGVVAALRHVLRAVGVVVLVFCVAWLALWLAMHV
jgi:hypothetical protein